MCHAFGGDIRKSRCRYSKNLLHTSGKHSADNRKTVFITWKNHFKPWKNHFTSWKNHFKTWKYLSWYVCNVFGMPQNGFSDMSVKFLRRLRRRCTIQQCNATRRFHPPKKITGRINPAPVETRPRHVSYPRRVTMDVVYIPRFLYDLYLTKIYSARKISRPTIPPQKYYAPKMDVALARYNVVWCM